MSSVWHSDPIAIDELNQFFSRVAIPEVLGDVLRPGARQGLGTEAQLSLLLGGPGWNGADYVTHHLIEGGVDLVLVFGAGVA
jgi:hypothetical protein